MLPTHQLPLRLPLRDDAIFENFFEGKNAQVIAQLKSDHEPFVYCYGESGSGRTHLLQAICHANNNIFYLPLVEHALFSPEIFESLETQACVCIDDVNAIAGNIVWEEALFHFYNRARDHHVRLIMSANLPPKKILFSLPDLQSRLSSGLILEIQNLNDDEKMYALQLRAHARGLLFSEDVAYYVIHHYSRNMTELMRLLSLCDEMSLITKRKITIPFIKKILEK